MYLTMRLHLEGLTNCKFQGRVRNDARRHIQPL